MKTTGGKGLHVVFPLTAKADWDSVKAFALSIATAMAADRPGLYTANMAPADHHQGLLRERCADRVLAALPYRRLYDGLLLLAGFAVLGAAIVSRLRIDVKREHLSGDVPLRRISSLGKGDAEGQLPLPHMQRKGTLFRRVGKRGRDRTLASPRQSIRTSRTNRSRTANRVHRERKGSIMILRSAQPQSGTGQFARSAMAYVLAGGRGSRLLELTDIRAKPAVYFGGKSRIIDFALSNALNSGIRRIGVATQYKAHSLIRHLQRGWNFLRPERNESFDILPASQRVRKPSGTSEQPMRYTRTATSSRATIRNTWWCWPATTSTRWITA